jgi:four helix bundle protein
MAERLKSYKELEVWKASMDFVVEIYKITEAFPGTERYGLISQIRRSSVSIPSNIAEGAGRKNTGEFIQFLYVSNGSLSEVETQLEIAKRLNYIENNDDCTNRIKHIRTMLINLIKALNQKLNNT